MDPTQQLGPLGNTQLQGAVAGAGDMNQSLGVSLASGVVPGGADGNLQNQNTNSASSLDGDGDIGNDSEGVKIPSSFHLLSLSLSPLLIWLILFVTFIVLSFIVYFG